MSDIDDLMSRLPFGAIATQLGVDEPTAKSAVAQALPALLGGLAHQSADDSAAQRLTGALTQHDNDLAHGTISLDEVNTADGAKIVSHIFGNKTDAVAAGISDQIPAAAVDKGLIQKLLPILAPIVMSFLMSKMTGAKSGTAGGAGDLGSILGGILGGGLGGTAGGSASPKSGGLGGILGGVLGGILGRK
ncbi:MAG: DUF937 domain-containing protein [Gordonia sp. (in: high G+C Gram-positive bacteria)]